MWKEISGGLDTIELGSREVNSRQYVSWFNFKGRDQQRKVGALSGGERRRVELARILSRQELESYMRMQIEEAVYYLFTWTQGTFSFEPDVRPEQQDVIVSINPESLLLEMA